MNYQDFVKECMKYNIEGLDEKILKKLFLYMNLLLCWNEKMNLTAITEPKDIILKHFIDSLTIKSFIKNDSKLIDVGTGAGFPGIPLKVFNEKIDVMLADSLNKRIKFLEEVIKGLELKDITVMHARAEDLGQNEKFREKYDVATSRAVAQLNVLLEYMLPLVKVGGICICMKGANVAEEISEVEKALTVLGGKIEKIQNLKISNMERNIVIVRKIKETDKKYPRKSGVPTKNPIQ